MVRGPLGVGVATTGVREIIKNGCKQFKKTTKRQEERSNNKIFNIIRFCDFYIIFVISMYFFFLIFLYQEWGGGVLGLQNKFKNS